MEAALELGRGWMNFKVHASNAGAEGDSAVESEKKCES